MHDLRGGFHLEEQAVQVLVTCLLRTVSFDSVLHHRVVMSCLAVGNHVLAFLGLVRFDIIGDVVNPDDEEVALCCDSIKTFHGSSPVFCCGVDCSSKVSAKSIIEVHYTTPPTLSLMISLKLSSAQ